MDSADNHTATGVYSVNATDCFTSLASDTGAIYGRPLNLTGTDDMCWATNGQDTYMTFHGPTKGKFQIDWMQGNATYLAAVDPDAASNGGANGASTMSAAAAMTYSTIGLAWLVVVGLVS
jgi:hypothetical protein